MICCSRCFNDNEVIAIIESSKKKGICETCGAKETFLYNTNDNSILTAMFEDLLNIYKPAEFLQDDYPMEHLKILIDELIDWGIFSESLDRKKITKLVKCICKDKYQRLPQLFEGKVGIEEWQDKAYLEKHAIMRSNSWEDFVNYLRNKNRFHTHHVNTDVLKEICNYVCKFYKAGDIFFRGRMSHKDGYSKDEMGAPPEGKITAGRANSQGIGCLYLANDLKTTLCEVRAGAYDYVTVGEFRLLEDINVVYLKAMSSLSPFRPDYECKSYAINKETLRKINREMAKPLRRSDSPLEYLPTQYISEFIKSIEQEDGEAVYAGVEYESTLNRDGYNLAIFNSRLFECINVKTYRITDIKYEHESV